MKKIAWIVGVLVIIVCLCWSVYRDYQIEKIYPSDLRNRIVGARLQKDGKLPYFYKWKPGDGIRYYDPHNFDTLRVSNITASPFFHQMLYPIADLQQRTISRFWVFLQYILLFTMTALALMIAQTALQKAVVLATATSFLFTEAWINLIAPGQNYLFIPFFAMLCYMFLRKPDNLMAAFLAGLCAVSLVLIRLNSVLLFLPLLCIAARYSTRYKVMFFIPVISMLGFIAIDGHQRALWKDYKASLADQLKLHQNVGAIAQHNAPDPEFPDWEGWNMAQLKEENARTSYVNYSENGNFFVLVRDVLDIKLSPSLLMLASISLIAIVLFLYSFFPGKPEHTLFNAIILGYCMYMISDLFSPIYRHQYYTVQWFFPLLLATSGYIKTFKWIYFALAFGIFLNIINAPFIKMEHTLGEYIIFAALLLLAFVYHHKPQLNHQFHTQFN